MKTEETKMSTINRRRRILQLLAEKGEVYVSELSKTYDVSEVTIRNDLEHLERKNLLLRSRGGAIRLDNNSDVDKEYSEKARLNFKQKSRIGRSAASLLENNDTVIIGPGTTTAELARNIPEGMSLTVITNALHAIQHLLSKPLVNIIILGGNLKRQSAVLTGPITELGLKNFYVDKVFLGADGCDTKRGIYTSDLETAQVMKLMINNAREVILLSDSSKFSKKSLTLMCPFDHVNIVVTDNRIALEDRRRLEDRGGRVIIS